MIPGFKFNGLKKCVTHKRLSFNTFFAHISLGYSLKHLTSIQFFYIQKNRNNFLGTMSVCLSDCDIKIRVLLLGQYETIERNCSLLAHFTVPCLSAQRKCLVTFPSYLSLCSVHTDRKNAQKSEISTNICLLGGVKVL